ncbi:MAG: (E)-4-hydroxy-3-methylbut-2-enyl-diphosphate synthase [Deltaproteobacteria bacterium]|nr:(E)-4-hydroxy-3-methylbut-2-enyl-diphosphate synthase [Deltaproteobacteria bacterium]
MVHPNLYTRRPTRTVFVGHMGMGGNNPIRIQSMTSSSTKDTDATIAEIKALVHAGCEIVRLTVPTKADCDNLKNIRRVLKQKKIKCPLVADIHFTPSIAMEAVNYVEKIRINPGNFADKKLFEQRDYTDQEYAAEILRITEKFAPLVIKCRDQGVAMRIGTNHGSLSDRIMNRYGNTPTGMVESALEFLYIAIQNNFHDLVFSMKASNTKVMIAAYRLLAMRLDEKGMNYPFHLGVTEAGDGEDGRIKSSVGIGTLLHEGIGDTIRVSLTEDSVHEIPVAGVLAAPSNALFYIKLDPPPQTPPCHWTHQDLYNRHSQMDTRRQTLKQSVGDLSFEPRQVFSMPRRKSPWGTRFGNKIFESPARVGFSALCGLGNTEPVRVWTDVPSVHDFKNFAETVSSDPCFEGIEIPAGLYDQDVVKIVNSMNLPLSVMTSNIASINDFPDAHKVVCLVKSRSHLDHLLNMDSVHHAPCHLELCFKLPDYPFYTEAFLDDVKRIRQFANLRPHLGVSLITSNPAQDYRILASTLDHHNLKFPIHLRYSQNIWPPHTDASAHMGSLLVDGIGDSLQIAGLISYQEKLSLSYGILQACRVRITKTEFIACPSCGRTLFDLKSVTTQIKARTSHLKGVKIAIMGCIVNGPGEMADADFGYVGTGKKKVSLYVGKNCIEKNIPEDEALERLISLIKEHNRWVDHPAYPGATRGSIANSG